MTYVDGVDDRLGNVLACDPSDDLERMMSRTLTTHQIADMFDRTVKTVERWRSIGCPVDDSGDELSWDEDKVTQWAKERGLLEGKRRGRKPGTKNTKRPKSSSRRRRRNGAVSNGSPTVAVVDSGPTVAVADQSSPVIYSAIQLEDSECDLTEARRRKELD